MRFRTLFITLALIASSAQAQKLSELARPVPEALSAEAAMPAEMAAKYARVKQERRNKYTTPQRASQAATDAGITQKMKAYLTTGTQAYQIKHNKSDEYTLCAPNYKLANTSHGRESIKGKGGSFNIKKDRLSYAVLQNGNEICIINHDHHTVNMSEFEFSATGDVIRMEDNRIMLTVPVIDLAHGLHPMVHKVTCTHKASGAKYTFDVQMYWTKQMNLSGELHAYALMPMHDTEDPLGLLFDLDAKTLAVVELPLHINADGINGTDGRRGHSGASGTNQRTYKDSDGVSHTVAGTCGTPGKDGTDATDGTDGGRFLFCISPELVEAYDLDGIIAFVDAGKGGKGGKGGEGGKHGTGSGCTGKAADGKNGRDGKDGKQGDFLYVLSDVNTFYQKLLEP